MNPRTAIAAAALRVDRGHLECQTLILKCVCCGRPLAPGVVSRARDFEYPAHQRHRIAGLLRCDKSESHSSPWRRRPSLFLEFRAPAAAVGSLVSVRPALRARSASWPLRARVPPPPRPVRPIAAGLFGRCPAPLPLGRCSCRCAGLAAPSRLCTQPKSPYASACRPSPPFTPYALTFALFGVSIKSGQVQPTLGWGRERAKQRIPAMSYLVRMPADA